MAGGLQSASAAQHLELAVVAQQIVHGAVQHLELLSVPAFGTVWSIAGASVIIPAFP